MSVNPLDPQSGLVSNTTQKWMQRRHGGAADWRHEAAAWQPRGWPARFGAWGVSQSIDISFTLPLWPSTTMHPCLQVDEILNVVVKSMGANNRHDDGDGFINVEHDNGDRDAFVDMALTCRTFYEPAMNEHWRELRTIRKLLRYLPQDAVSMEYTPPAKNSVLRGQWHWVRACSGYLSAPFTHIMVLAEHYLHSISWGVEAFRATCRTRADHSWSAAWPRGSFATFWSALAGCDEVTLWWQPRIPASPKVRARIRLDAELRASVAISLAQPFDHKHPRHHSEYSIFHRPQTNYI